MTFIPILAEAGLSESWTGWHSFALLLRLLLYPSFKALVPHSLLLGSSCSILTRLSQPAIALAPALMLYAMIGRCKMKRRFRILLSILLYAGLTLTTNIIGDRGFYQHAWVTGARSKSIAFLQHADTAEGFSKRYASGIPGSIPNAFVVDGEFPQYSSGLLYVYPDDSWIVVVHNNSFSANWERLSFDAFCNVARDSSGVWLESHTHFSSGGHMEPLSTFGSATAAREYLTEHEFKPINREESPTRQIQRTR
jgi:hypothetical protein